MTYDLEESYIATIRDDVSKLDSPEKIRELCLEEDATDPDNCSSLTSAKRVGNRLLIKWLEGENETEEYSSNLSPYNPSDNSEVDYWQWGGEITCKYYSFAGGLHGDKLVPVREKGSIDGWMFEDDQGDTFVGTIEWDKTGDLERVIVELFETEEDS